MVTCPVKGRLRGWSEITLLGGVQVQLKINTHTPDVGQVTLHHCNVVVLFSEIRLDGIFSLGKLIPHGIYTKT